MTNRHTNTIKAEAKTLGLELVKADGGGWIAAKIDDTEWMTSEFETAEEALSEAKKELNKKSGSVVPASYKAKYKAQGDPTSCGDAVARTFKDFVTVGKKMSVVLLREVADANGLDTKLDEYQDKNLNEGMQRMNIGNILRNRVKKGELVVIGETKWELATE